MQNAELREAKAEAARERTTLTRFLEEGLRLRLTKLPKVSQPHPFPVYSSGKPSPLTDSDLRRIDNEEQERFYLKKIGIEPPGA